MYTKRKLSPEQLRQYLTCAREMEAEGNRMQIPQEWMKPSPVEIMRSDRSGQVSNNYGLFSYVIPVKVVAYSRVQICDYEVYSGLEDIEIYFPYVRQKNGRFRWESLDYPIAEVLNDRFETGFRLNFSGDVLEGVLIAHGGEVPELFGAPRPVTVSLSLIDSLGRRSAESAIEVPLTKQAMAWKITRSRASVSENGAHHLLGQAYRDLGKTDDATRELKVAEQLQQAQDSKQ